MATKFEGMKQKRDLHILDEISVSRAVDVSIMTVLGLVLDVSSGDGDTTSSLFGCLVNHSIVEELVGAVHFSHCLGNGSSECCLSVINMACKT